MVGTRQMQRVLKAASEAQAKVVLVGDTQQLQAIEAGAPMRLLGERFGKVSLTEIHRQRDPQQREAALQLATGEVEQALQGYHNQGRVSVHASRAAAMAAMVARWDAHAQAHPKDTQVMLAFRREEVTALNRMARSKRLEAGALGTAQVVQTSAGRRLMAQGERVTFLRNDRQLGVRNGTLGTVEHLKAGNLVVRLDGPQLRTVAFAVADYPHIDYGYAATVHKAQGLTAERAYVLATPHFDRHAAYVALTRHRADVHLHYGRDDFAAAQDLGRVLSRARAKDMALDHTEVERRNQVLAQTRPRQHRGTAQTYAQAQQEKRAALLRGPAMALRDLTRQRATFTRSDLERYFHLHMADDAQSQRWMRQVMDSPEVVALPHPGGVVPRFTTRQMLRYERHLLAHADTLHGQTEHAVEAAHVHKAVEPLQGQARGAAEAILQTPHALVVLEGFAGSGKSSLLERVHQGYAASGRRVVGAALSGQAAAGLEAASGIASRSLAAWEYSWKRGQAVLGPRDVLVIDEAGMVGTQQMYRVLKAASFAQAKVVLVGDTQQLQAIEAGAPMRLLAERFGKVSLTDIHRQRDPQQRAASQQLAIGEVAQALQGYRDQDRIISYASRAEAMAAMVCRWDAHHQKHPQDTQVMLAFRREEVTALNTLARNTWVAAGRLNRTRDVQTSRGLRPMAEGERVTFLRNDRQLDVQNGTLGTVERIDGEHMLVRLDGAEQRSVAFSVADYPDIDHGYAATVHKAQGLTVERAHVLATPHFDQHTAYVALTRHRDDVHLHYGEDDFATPQRLEQSLGRARPKEMGLDFEALEHIREVAESCELRMAQDAMRDNGREELTRPDGPERFAVEVPRPEHGLASPTEDLAAEKTWVEWQARQDRMAAYEADRRELEAVGRQPHKAPMTLEQAWGELREVDRAAWDLQCAEARMGRIEAALHKQQEREAAYQQEHPWRSYLGLEKERASWRALRQDLEVRAEQARAERESASAQVQALQQDPSMQRQALEVMATDHARRARDQAHLAALQERQQRDADRYAEDQAWHAKMTELSQERDARMASYQQLHQRLDRARDQLEQVRQTPERLWGELPEVQRAEERAEAAMHAREAAQDRMVAMERASRGYAMAHPMRSAVGYGVPYTQGQLDQAHADVSRAEEAEQQAQSRVGALRDDSQLQQQHATRCEVQRAACTEAQERVDELVLALREREELHERDVASSELQREYARGHERGIDLGR
jgi:Ti-type conjugative transfer relaxase TraA